MAKGKTKTFAEKMLKNLKAKDEFTTFRVVRPKVSDKNSVRFDSRIVKIHKEQSETEVIGA